MKNLNPIIDYSLFYGVNQAPESPLDILEGYDVEIVILTMVGLRNSLDKNKYVYARDGAIEKIIANLPADKAARLKYLLYGELKCSLVTTAVMDRILADLFSRLKNNPCNRPLEDGQFEQRILDVLLIYNQFQFDNNLEKQITFNHELIWTLVMMQGVSRVSKADFARTGVIKHVIMLDFLRSALGENFINLQKSLRKNTGLPSIYLFISYFKHIFQFLESNIALVPRLEREDPILPLLKAFDLIASAEVADTEGFYIGQLLTRPFFQTSTGDVFILDHRNFSLLMEQSFMYLLYHKSDFQKLINIKDMNGLYAYFGKKFYEGFLMEKLLRTLQAKAVRVISSDDNHLADFTIVVDEKDVFVIELKSVSLNYKLFEAMDAEGFRKHIDRHYLAKAGIRQLERNIDYIIADRQRLLNIKNPIKNLNIYPLLVVTDPRSATIGINDYLGQRANPIFSRFKTDFNKVMPLTMLQSDFFLENISLLCRDKRMLKNLIKGYHLHLKRCRKRFDRNSSIQNYMHSMVGFDQYALGKHGAYKLSQQQIHYHLEKVFGMPDSRPQEQNTT